MQLNTLLPHWWVLTIAIIIPLSWRKYSLKKFHTNQFIGYWCSFIDEMYYRSFCVPNTLNKEYFYIMFLIISPSNSFPSLMCVFILIKESWVLENHFVILEQWKKLKFLMGWIKMVEWRSWILVSFLSLFTISSVLMTCLRISSRHFLTTTINCKAITNYTSLLVLRNETKTSFLYSVIQIITKHHKNNETVVVNLVTIYVIYVKP